MKIFSVGSAIKRLLFKNNGITFLGEHLLRHNGQYSDLK